MGRLNIHCPHFSLCSGCVFDSDVGKPEILTSAQAFFASIGVNNFQLHCGQPVAWRTRAKVAVRGTTHNPVIGLFEKGSHRAVDIPHCRVHHPAINQAISEVRAWMAGNGIVPYAEGSSTGELRYLQLTVERETSKIQLVLVFNEVVSQRHKEAVKVLWRQNPDLWHSIWANENTRKDNVIFGSSWQLLLGERWLVEALRHQPLCFHPASFMQANLEMFAKLLNKIAEGISSDKDVLDLYAGVGAIGVAVSDKCRSVICVETNPMAKECFEETSKRIAPSLSARLSFITAHSEACLHLLKEKDVQTVIVDPPRKGLERSILKTLNEAQNVQELVYVSCGWPAFQRDCQYLLAGGWRLKAADAFLFFPGSDHLEVLAFFERKDK